MDQNNRPWVSTIAGLDPSAGAGLLADIKTIEGMGGRALGVCTAITVQDDLSFSHLEWTRTSLILDQLKQTCDRFQPSAFKIGITESQSVLKTIAGSLPDHPTIVWDPVLSSSTGFQFWQAIDHQSLPALLNAFALITPNEREACQLSQKEQAGEGAEWLSQFCPVLITGGHEGAHDTVTDTLYIKGKCIKKYTLPYIPYGTKHGSGCALSSAITTALAQGHSLESAIVKGHDFVRRFLTSNPSLMGQHPSFVA
ncbi:MAG: hydroxymethylpyrimidine/phosphomethylpyrimidine kinase [Flavobacteriales bacterium]|nr:hydroxymethylpyrimidine/phosphomethylpyrimidine kinase [Flavobacteriales bacterium]